MFGIRMGSIKHRILCIDSKPKRGEAMAKSFSSLAAEVYSLSLKGYYIHPPSVEKKKTEKPEKYDLAIYHYSDFDLNTFKKLEVPDETPIVFYSGGGKPINSDPNDTWIQQRKIDSAEDALKDFEAKEILEWLDEPTRIPSVFLPPFYPENLQALNVLCQGHLIVHINPETGKPDTNYDEQTFQAVYDKMGLTDLLNGKNKAFLEATKLTDSETRADKQADVTSAAWWSDTFEGTDIKALFNKEKEKLGPSIEDWEPIEMLLTQITNGRDIDCDLTAAAYLKSCKILPL